MTRSAPRPSGARPEVHPALERLGTGYDCPEFPGFQRHTAHSASSPRSPVSPGLEVIADARRAGTYSPRSAAGVSPPASEGPLFTGIAGDPGPGQSVGHGRGLPRSLGPPPVSARAPARSGRAPAPGAAAAALLPATTHLTRQLHLPRSNSQAYRAPSCSPRGCRCSRAREGPSDSSGEPFPRHIAGAATTTSAPGLRG